MGRGWDHGRRRSFRLWGGIAHVVVSSKPLLQSKSVEFAPCRPFVVGDAVSVRSGAAIIAQGTIANISPLRTTFLDESSHTVTLPNKMLSDMIITNIDQDPSRVRVRNRPALLRFINWDVRSILSWAGVYWGVLLYHPPCDVFGDLESMYILVAYIDVHILQRARSKASQKIKHVMNYEFTLKRPAHYRPMQSYDDYAKSVIRSLLVRLSILPNIVRNTATSYVSSLTAAGEIVIKV